MDNNKQAMGIFTYDLLYKLKKCLKTVFFIIRSDARNRQLPSCALHMSLRKRTKADQISCETPKSENKQPNRQSNRTTQFVSNYFDPNSPKQCLSSTGKLFSNVPTSEIML